MISLSVLVKNVYTLEHFWRSCFFLFQMVSYVSVQFFVCFFLALAHLQVCMCAYGRIDIFFHIVLPDFASSVIWGGRHQSCVKSLQALIEVQPQHRRLKKGQYAAAQDGQIFRGPDDMLLLLLLPPPDCCCCCYCHCCCCCYCCCWCCCCYCGTSSPAATYSTATAAATAATASALDISRGGYCYCCYCLGVVSGNNGE